MKKGDEKSRNLKKKNDKFLNGVMGHVEIVLIIKYFKFRLKLLISSGFIS